MVRSLLRLETFEFLVGIGFGGAAVIGGDELEIGLPVFQRHSPGRSTGPVALNKTEHLLPANQIQKHGHIRGYRTGHFQLSDTPLLSSTS